MLRLSPAQRSAREVAMVRILGVLATVGLFATAAMADCADSCDNGFNVRAHNGAAELGWLFTRTLGRASCLALYGASSRNLTKRPTRLADQCGASPYSCPGTCCYSTSRGYYCADANGEC
jgi:hypothetical protein